MGIENLARMWAKADRVDIAEGMVAYDRYNIVMRRLAKKYEFPVDIVCAVFVSLSPNSDYVGNLRSTVSVLQGLRSGTPDADIVVSTYGHCKTRALAYARGQSDFLRQTKGLKILNFYHNILSPHSWRYVTIDGHMVAAWRGDDKATMKEALVKPSEYNVIASGVKQFAFFHFIAPNQMQAILWFVRKRVLNIKYDPQLDLLNNSDDAWRTLRDVDGIRPYTKRDADVMRYEAAMQHKQETLL